MAGGKFSSGVLTYVPKRCTEFDAVGVYNFLGSVNVCCQSGSILQCKELGHAQASVDHFPMSGVFRFPRVTSPAPIPRKKVRYDRAALGDADKSQTFINLLENLPEVDVSVDNTSHCHILQHNVHIALCLAFPFEKSKGKVLSRMRPLKSYVMRRI